MSCIKLGDIEVLLFFFNLYKNVALLTLFTASLSPLEDWAAR